MKAVSPSGTLGGLEAKVRESDEKILEMTIKDLRLEKQQAAVQKAHYGALLHKDGILAKRTGKKPDRSISAMYMKYDGIIEKLDHELRMLDTSLPPIGWNDAVATSHCKRWGCRHGGPNFFGRPP